MAIAFTRKLIYCRTEGNCLMSPAMLAAQWPQNCYSTAQLPEIYSSVKDIFESVSSESTCAPTLEAIQSIHGNARGVSRREASSPVAQTPLLTTSWKKRPLSKPHQSSAEHSVSCSLEIAQMKRVVLILRQKWRDYYGSLTLEVC